MSNKSDEIFETEYDSPSEEIEVKKKPKRKLTEKQLANLAKGRLKMQEKRRLKKLGEVKKEKKLIVKEEKKAVKEIKSTKKEQKKKQKALLKEQHLEQAYFDELKQREIDSLKNGKLSRFQQIRTRYLTNCKTTEEFTQLKKHLDEIDDEDVLDDVKLKGKLLKMISGYTKIKQPEEKDNLKIEIDVKGLEKK